MLEGPATHSHNRPNKAVLSTRLPKSPQIMTEHVFVYSEKQSGVNPLDAQCMLMHVELRGGREGRGGGRCRGRGGGGRMLKNRIAVFLEPLPGAIVSPEMTLCG